MKKLLFVLCVLATACSLSAAAQSPSAHDLLVIDDGSFAGIRIGMAHDAVPKSVPGVFLYDEERDLRNRVYMVTVG